MADMLTTTAAPTAMSSAGTNAATEPTTSTAGTLSGWATPYVGDMLGKGMAYSNMGFTPYTGEMVAGPSDLQNKAFSGLAGLAAYNPTQFSPERATSSEFTGDVVSKYASPFVSNVVSPQLREAQRQAEIQRIQNAGKLVGAGAFGGSRQAIMEAEGNRNLQTLMSDITGKGYQSAFENAQQQFERDQARRMAAQSTNIASGMDAQRAQEAANQFGAGYGLDTLARQLSAGETQRGIGQAGLSADYEQYMRQFNYPKEQLQFMSDLLKNIPEKALTTTNIYGTDPSTLSKLLGAGSGILALLGSAGALAGGGNSTTGLGNIYGGISDLFGRLFSGSGGGGFDIEDGTFGDGFYGDYQYDYENAQDI